MTTVSQEKAGEGSFPAAPQVPESTASLRACAREDTPSAARLPSSEVTQRVRALEKVRAWTAARLALVTGYLDGQDSLFHAHPPTFARARELHHERAARHNLWAPVRVARLAWGYFHLVIIKPALNFAEWVTETPLRLSGAVLLALIVWHWS